MNTTQIKPAKNPIKLHKKHIVPGFMYAPRGNTKDLRMVVELVENDHRYCKIYLVTEMKYLPNDFVRQAIVEGIRKGTLVCMTGDEYR